MTTIETSRSAAETLPQAILCDVNAERLTHYREAVQEMNYQARPCLDLRETMAALRDSRPGTGLMLVHQRFGPGGDTPPEAHPVLQWLHGLPGRARRQLCVGLVGPDLRTLDPMLAFCLSVNFLVGERDLPQLRSVLRRALSDHAAFFGPLLAAMSRPTPTRRSTDPAR